MKYITTLTFYERTDNALRNTRIEKGTVLEGEKGAAIAAEGYAVPLLEGSKLETKVIVPDVKEPAKKPTRKRRKKVDAVETKEG